MKGRYPIDRQFGIWAKFTPSLSRGFLRLAAFFLPLMPKGLSDRRVNVTRVTFEKGGKALLIAAADCAENAPCLVCFHGGGFVFDAARYHYENAKRYALMAGCKVFFVRYPLAPGNPWPAPNDACLAAYRHVLSHPAAYVETAEFDCLHDEGARFAERLAAAGVSVQYNETKGTMHGFDAARKSAAAVKAVKERAAALRRAFEEQ